MKSVGYIRGTKIDLVLAFINDQGMQLEERAARWYLAMKRAAKADGIELTENTAFRDMAHQQRLYRAFLQARTAYHTALAKGQKASAPSLVAEPGYSTHQSGRSVDVNRAHDDHTNDGIANGATDMWLAANAKRFGFVRDVRSEPWHWTFDALLVQHLEEPIDLDVWPADLKPQS